MEGQKSNFFTWVVVVVVIAVGIFLYSTSSKVPQETGPVKIGVMLPLTGDAASYGEGGRNVYQLAVEEINAAGGVDGRQIELVIEDSKCNGKDASSAAQKLINIDKVQIILGGFCSGESIAATPIAAAGKVALFSPGSSSPDLTNISPYFFRNYPSDASQGKVLAETAYNSKQWKKVAVIQEQTDYALGVFKSFSTSFEGFGGTIVKEETETANSDFRSILTKLKAANADALFIDTQTPAMSDRILKQVQDLGWKPAIIINDATAGDVALVMKYKNLLEGAITAEFSSDPKNPTMSKLLASYKTKFNADLPFQAYGQTEYDAVYMIRDAVKTVGYNGEKIAAWSRTVKDWEGASGKVTIGSNGDRVGGHTVEVVKAGKVEKYVQ
ncbi:MAG: ABC transporter substrate-binding protein [Patescibacteria group bacterium]